MTVSPSFIRKSADALLQIFSELEATAALDRQDPAFLGSLRRRIREAQNDGPPSRLDPNLKDQKPSESTE